MKIKVQNLANTLSNGYTFITKDEDGQIGVFQSKPFVSGDHWGAEETMHTVFPNFPFDIEWGTEDWKQCMAERQKDVEPKLTTVYAVKEIGENGEQKDVWIFTSEEVAQDFIARQPKTSENITFEIHPTQLNLGVKK